MKKIKLFMMLALLVMGISNVWAKTYTVKYVGLPSGTSGDYTVNTSDVQTNQSYSSGWNSHTVYNRYQKGSSTSLTITAYYESGWNTTNISDDYIDEKSIPYYITPKNVNNMAVSITVNDGVITISYSEGTVFYTWSTVPNDIEGGAEVKSNSITYTYNNQSFTSRIGLTELKGGGDAVYVTPVPYRNLSVGNQSINVPYYITGVDYNGFVGNPGPITNSNIATYIQAKEVSGYSATISNVQRGDYTNVNTFVITYTPTTHSRTYRVSSNLDDGGIQSYNWPHNEAASLSGNTLTISTSQNSSYAPVKLTTSNVNDYIVPKAVSGYNVKITVNENEEVPVILLNYYKTWTKDGLEYSTFHIQSTNNQGMMDSHFDFISGQPEVAVRLYLDKTKIVTDTVKYEEPLWDNPTENQTRTLTDDDGDGVGINAQGKASTSATNAEYTYLGQLDEEQDYPMGHGDYFYLRKHAIAYSDRTSVTIPREVTFGNTTYKVTAIQKWGMDYAQTHIWVSDYCYNMNTGGEAHPDKETKASEYQNINSHRNEYLKTVTFEMSATNPSNIHSIGDYAFMSLFNSSIDPIYTGLEEIVIPNSTTYLGTGAFEMCLRLKDVTFQKVFDESDQDYYDKTRIKAIRDYTFYSCIRLGEINLPIGIETIGNCAFQYNFQMSKIELPNGLKSVGDHFLCCASSLINVTIPFSVTQMAGACFHGCESLKNVYLMGPASALIKESGSGGTFDANPRFCKEHVQNCTFWVFNEYYDGYKNDEVWSEIDENKQHTGMHNGHPCVNGNELKIVPDETRTFEADKWVTAIFPNAVENYKTVFKANGDKETRVARMTSATVTEGVEKDPKTGRPLRMYNLTFELITTDYIPAGEPLMICPATRTEITLYTANQSENDPDFKDHMTDKHPVEASCGEKGKVVMKGQYSPYDLQKWDFFFAYPIDKETGKEAKTAKFYRVPEDSNYKVDRCRCWWTIEAEGVKINSSASPSAKGFSFFDDATGINNVETRIAIDAIYDLNGRKIDIDPASLPKGMYIKNGKKYIKN